MEATDDQGQRLKTSESKSMGIDTGNSVMMSSIDGWKRYSLPKLLIIWRFDKERSNRVLSVILDQEDFLKREIFLPLLYLMSCF